MDTLTLNLRLLDFDGKPRKNANVLVRVEAPDTGAASNTSEQTLTTDGEGNLSVEVAPHVADGSIEVDGVVLNLGIGGLDPVDTDSGAAQRLANLGYLVLDDDDLDPTLLRLAIEDFQTDNQLQISGKRADVEAKLLEVYGS